MPKTQHLMQRGQTWYIRLRVPTDLLSEYDGTKEVQRSLKTRDYDEARKLVTTAKLEIENEFEAKRRKKNEEMSGKDVLSTLSSDDLYRLAAKCYFDLKKESDKRAAKASDIEADDDYHAELQQEVDLFSSSAGIR